MALYVCGLPEDSSFSKAQCIITDAYQNKDGVVWLKLLKHQKGNNFIPLTRLASQDEVEPLGRRDGKRLKQICDGEITICASPLTHETDLTSMVDNSPVFLRETLNDKYHQYRDIHTNEVFELRNPSYAGN